jgi:hypothetical protein
MDIFYFKVTFLGAYVWVRVRNVEFFHTASLRYLQAQVRGRQKMHCAVRLLIGA